MKCAKESCGAEIADGAKFCIICGTKVVVTTTVKKALCPECNHFVLESHNFCLNCGWKVNLAIFTDKICKGVKENGEQCSVILTFDAKFCPSCGTPTKTSDVSSEPVKPEQGTTEDLDKDTNLNPVVSIQKSETTFLTETKDVKENENLIEPERIGLHVESDRNSDESEPGSPEIWTPPSLFKESSESSDRVETSTEKVEIKEKTNGNQVQVSQENILTDLNQQKEDSQGDTKGDQNGRSKLEVDKDFKDDVFSQSNRTNGQQISKPTETCESGQSHDMTGGQPKLDHAVIDKTKSEQSTETKTNEENNRNQNETFDITDGNQSSLQMPTGDLDTEKKDKKADEQSDRKRKDIKDNDTAGVLKSIVDDKEESFSSDFVAEKQFNSQSELNESENGTEKVKPPVSDSQLIEKVEGKTESGLEEQTLAEKPGISPPATGESENREKVDKVITTQPESNNLISKMDASVSGLQTVGSEDKSLTVENVPEKPAISPSTIVENTENNNDRQLVHSSHNLNDTEKDETETKPFEAENTDESLIAGNVSSEKNEKHESEQEEAESSTDDSSSSYQSADDEFQQASNAGSEIMLSKESKDDVKEGDASQDHQKKGPKQKSSTKLKREKKKDRKRKKLDREKETEDELVEGGKTHQHTNIDTKTALVKKETEENKEIVKPQDKIENKQLATAEALKEGAIGTSGECTTNTDNESDNIGKEKQNSESEIGKGEEINSREQEVSQNQKEKNDKHNAEEQETEDKASKSESESDDTSEEDTETTESPKKKPKVKTKVVNKNDGQRKNAAAQTQDANNPGTKPGNKNNKESETNSAKQKTSSDQASKTRNTMNSSNRGKSISTFIVNFHASLHAAFYIKPCKIYVRFGLDNLGGWKSVAHEMHIVGEYKNGNVKLGASVSIPRGCLNNSITYRYCIVYDDKQEIEEFIYNNPISTRYLYVLASELKQMGDGNFHQYNGVIRGPIEGKGIANYLWKLSGYDDLLYKKELLNDLHFSAHILLPVLPASSKSFEGSTGEEFAMLVCLVRSGLLTCYRDYCSDTEFDKIFFEALYSTFDSLVSDLHAKRDLKKKEDRIKVLVSAVTEIYLIDEYKLAISDDERNILCRTLLPECSQGNSCCPDVESLRDAFPSSFQKMRQAIINFVEPLTKKHGNLNWIYSMPLIHFLCGQCTPGEKPTEDFRHDQSAKWWGHASDDRLYWFDLKSQKEKIFDTKKLEEVLEAVGPYFEADYLLPRTLVACLRLEQLPYVVKSEHIPCIPPDVILASVCFFIKTEKVISKNDKKETAILECLTEAIGWNNIEDERSVSSLTDAHRSFKISSTLLHETFYRKDKLRDIVLARTLEACLISMDLFYKKNEAVDNANKSGMREDVKNCLDTAEDITKYWLRSKLNFSKSSELLGCLKAWDRILNIGIPEGEVKVQFTKCIVDCLHNELRIQTHEEELVKVYCQNQNVFCDKLLEVLTYYAFAAVEECGKNITILSKLDEKQMKTFGALLSSVFEKKYEKENIKDQKVLLQISTTWTPFPLYIKMIFNNIHGTCLSERCKRLLHSSLDCVREITVTLLEGNILVKNLLLVQEKEDAFSSIIKEMRDFDYQTFQKAVEVRTTEYNAFRECERNLKRFIDLCHRCEANTLELEQQIGKYQDIDKTVLTDICSTVDLKKDIKKYKPKIIAFEIDRNILALLPEIIQCSSKGSLFLAIWERYGTQIVGSVQRALDITEIIDQVWKPAHQEWKTFVKRLKNGDILFKEFDSICGRSNQDTLRKEFQILEGGKDATWIKQRIDQMEKFRNLENYVKGAETIMKVVKEFQLEGNFKPIEQILNMTKGGKNFKMNKLKPALFRPCQVLSNIDNQKTKCLVKFIKSKPLIDWLRDSMPEGIKELKVFVDLAYISTGDDGMEIAKVTCFQSAAIGYAPLIFNLDAKCGYKDFLERCEEVWKALDSNPKLPKQLESTCQQLEWLKIVEQSHGSVEVTSLAQAEAINSSGIYHIGVLPSKNEQQQLELSDVLELQVMEKQEGQYLRRNYSFDQLHDLQSRLMLVAGKAALGKDDVDRFTLILDAVVRLCKIYIKLLSSGCVLFSKFHVMFRCDAKSATCAFVSFGEAENKHTIRGKVDEENKDVSFFVPKIAKFLEQCHDRWLEFIDNKREVEYILNFFTIEQMVILQQELVKLGSRVEVSNLIYPLLSIIKRDCTREDLVEAMEDARIELEQIEVKTEEEEEENQMEESSVVAKAKFIVEIVEAGYPEVLAKAALNDGCDPTMVDEGIAWCIEHETDYIEDELSTNEGEEKPFLGWQFTREISLSNVRAELLKQLGVDANSGIDNSVNTLIANLDKLWTTFIKSISSSVCDYLSVEHLALILRKLADKDDETIDRSFAICGCKEGIPNLIICPQSEMYNTVLSLYSTEEDSPLPLSDEVLLCTPCTTLDMLEIFWRRALFSDVNKIHCLVNADLLDYEVSDKGEKSLERHMKTANNRDIQYKLVVICSTENEYKSRMVAALDKYRIPQIAFGGEAHVKEYVSKSFIMENKDSRVDPASSVDFNRSSVRVVKSWRAGVGKSLFKRNMVAALQREQGIEVCVVSIPLYDQHIVVDEVMEVLLEHTNPPHVKQPRIFHIDISHEVQEGADAFLFQLLVLGCLSHSSGNVWRRSDIDYYIIESMPLLARDSDTQAGKLKCMHHCLDILPDVLCRSPKESLEILDQNLPKDYHESDLVFDETEFTSAVFQRPFQYLRRLDEEEELADINLEEPEGDKQKCLVVLLRHCGVRDPSWSELYHFVSFLNRQLQDFETSSFCNPIFLNDLPGFRSFVLKFMIQMSRDFATRSLLISEESPADMLKRQLIDEEDEDDIEQLYVMRRTWETSPHPYLFFNPDHHTVTFLGFNIQRNTGNLIDEQTKELLQERIMEPTFTEYQRTLYNGLESQHVNLSENFDELTRGEKIEKLCQVMGIEFPHDPDETYELTTDNVKKMLAIYMRFRCDIPVIIMGETGCGKTRLIKYMCALQHFPEDPVENMIIMKVHGGTTRHDIIQKVKRAEEIAKKNTDYFLEKRRESDEDGGIEESLDHENNMFTVLFFDEANTTEAIGVIKEIMCDKSLGGKPIHIHEQLKIVAACNPYRKHKEELIKKLEQAGLGYHVDADKTADRLGRVPMRRLVYRVQPLPQSMLPLVWDFGQLNAGVEELYIRQMVLRYISDTRLPDMPNLADVLSKILGVCQNFMRLQEDECSFVSLRDVERVLKVMTWFYIETEEGGFLFNDMAFEEEDIENINITRALILALGVCYQACLKRRQDFRDMIVEYFEEPFHLLDVNQLESELLRCQDVFLNTENVKLDDNIARNQALKENVFMMIVCIELRIPLFLVGKPGSSKSLAKTIVADAMQGHTARTDLFKSFKQVQMVSFQCSPLSTPDGIVGTFRQCAEFQKAKDLDRFVSVVVLDEIGLAEDSPKMPLKTLHPLLEDGCPGDEYPEDYMQVAFIGISNWALDPAKMNRGIFVQREVPDKEELIKSAKGICRTSADEDGKGVLKLIETLIPALSTSYLELFSETEKTKQREFFGLRDFYSLIKMVYAFAAKTESSPTWLQLKHAIMRNFGGLENVRSVEIFHQSLKKTTMIMDEKRQEGDPDCSPGGMIQACLEGDKTNTSETRYLLLLTENYGDLAILQQKISCMHDAVVIFGSSFPSDQEYTQVCRNINRIKVNMETGSTVILLNLENLYESLYDALNQYYVRYGGENYVDLGLGSHRVKCKVHRDFRLIVVAEKEIVYKKFPIPLINRLEKHVLSLRTMLSETQFNLAEQLNEWVEDFCQVELRLYQRNKSKLRGKGDVFLGFHADTCAAIIMQLFEDKKCPYDVMEQSVHNEILKEAKAILLWCAAPDAIFRLKATKLREKCDEFMEIYLKYQKHDSLLQYIYYQVTGGKKGHMFSQVTTHSKLLSTPDLEDYSVVLHIQRQNMTLFTLQSFDTEQQFCRQIRFILEKSAGSDSLLIVQCDCGDQNADLIACARYSIQGELKQTSEKLIGNVYVILIIQLPRVAGQTFTGFQCGLWHSVHIDELRPPPKKMPSLFDMYHKPVSAILEERRFKAVVKPGDDAKHFLETDIDIDTESEIVEIDECLDILSLILNCVQPALALVKEDPDKDSQRTTERIKVVLNLIQESSKTDEKSFLSGIAVHLKSLLKEKEVEESELHREWLSTEASNPDHINSAGTFRRAAMQCLEEKMTSLLAGVIAFIDKNRNMNIIACDQVENWQRFLWLEILNSPQVTGLHYIDFVAQSYRTTTEYMVQGTAYEGGDFPAKVPFSWIIYSHIDDILKSTSEEPQPHGQVAPSSYDLVMLTASRLESTTLGQLLSQIEGTHVQQVIRCYVIDFVHMAHPVKSESEHRIMCENIITSCKLIIKGEIGRLFPALIGCHKGFEIFGPRFRNFSDILHVWPECCEKVLKFEEESDKEMMYLLTDDEITLDLMGLHILLRNLEPPTKEALNKASSRKQWIKKLCDFRPVVERIFGYFSFDSQEEDFRNSPRCTQGVQTARNLWTRAIVMKLFIEHVCIEDSEVRRCMPLWAMLKGETDMKKLQSVEKVEKFIKSCNKEVSSKIFGKEKCSHCMEQYTGSKDTLPSTPVTLPCHHTICRRCFDETIATANVKCPKCDKKFEKDMEPIPGDQSETIYAYQDFRRRCNSFFMEVVSQLCFADGTPPCDEVVEKLLSFITIQTRKGQQVTKELTIFDDCIDPTPVVRSFLLQHLMRTSGTEVNRHLEQYFRRALRVFDPSKEVHTKPHDMCLLVIQCMEDSCHQQYSEENPEQILAAMEMLRNANTKIKLDTDQLIENMDHLSRTRFSLSIAAKFMYKVFVEKSVTFDRRLKRLFESVDKICTECGSVWPKRFFVKYICRYYGIDSYQTIRRDCDLTIKPWINLPELQKDKTEECCDRFIVCGIKYCQMRETFVRAALNKDAQQLENLLQCKRDHWITEISFLLVVYREVTMNFLYEEEEQQFSKVKHFLQRTLMNSKAVKDKDLIQDILTNTIWRHDRVRNISLEMDLSQQGLSCLLAHCLILFKKIPGQQTWLTPLTNFANHPELMVECYFPTMPQDDLDEVKEAVLAAREESLENPVFYRCPNGHLYIIGDCGRPTYADKCRECGQEIGGESYELKEGNIKDAGFDTTHTGHILGRARNLNAIPYPERKLNRANCAILKFILHIAMYIGAKNNVQAVCRSIKPDIEGEDVPAYITAHMLEDLRSISNVLGKSKEDVVLLIHFLLSEIMNNQTAARVGERVEDDICLLRNKRSRAIWEEKFNKRYIVPVLEKSEEILQEVTHQIVADKRLGADPLLQLLYETNNTAEVIEDSNLCENPSVWQFRDRISVNHLIQMFTRSKQNCPVMKQFLEEEHFLRAIRFVPSIIKLQRILIQKYSRKLNRTEASSLSMDKVLTAFKNDPRRQDLENCWTDFKQVWESLRHYLDGYGFPLNGSFVYLSKENCQKRMDDKTAVSYILPANKEHGLCSYVLLFFLLEKQNLFLQKYCIEGRIKYDSLPRVKVKDLSTAHLISYHPDRDLLPMVLANCNYSFEVGQGTKVEYNFVSLERQLMDRLLFTKSVILLKEIDTVVYRSETTNAIVFTTLRDKIRQERISPAVVGQIEEELRSKTFPDLCGSMDTLDIAISFLKSVGAEPESLLNDFIVNILKIDHYFVSQKAQMCCKCKHVQSLWITLALEKTKRLEKHYEESFDGVSSAFKEKLSEEQSRALYDIFGNLQIEQLACMSEIIFECILLNIDIPKKDEESVDMSREGFKEALSTYLFDPPYVNEALTPDWLKHVVDALPLEENTRIFCCHVVETWVFINEMYTEKKDEI